VSDLGELAELFGLRCWRCGRAGADALDEPGALRALLHPEPLTGAARLLERPQLLRTIRQADVERAGRPVHRECRPGWRPRERGEQPPAGYFDRSVR
jgi:hypothetical protein